MICSNCKEAMKPLFGSKWFCPNNCDLEKDKNSTALPSLGLEDNEDKSSTELTFRVYLHSLPTVGTISLCFMQNRNIVHVQEIKAKDKTYTISLDNKYTGKEIFAGLDVDGLISPEEYPFTVAKGYHNNYAIFVFTVP